MTRTYLIVFTRSLELSEPEVFLSCLGRHLSGTRPKRFWRHEDERFPFCDDNVGQFVQLWWGGILGWDSKRPEVYGSVDLGNEHIHTGILHTFDTSLASDDSSRAFLIELSKLLQADYALLHAVSAEGKIPLEEGEIVGVTSKGLRLRLPGVPWAACYGKPYVELFGKKNLLSVPVAQVVEVSSDIVFCQITNRLADCVDRPKVVEEQRRIFVEHIGRDAFFDPKAPDLQRRAPEFRKPVTVRPSPG
jgi:hypothetical protein